MTNTEIIQAIKTEIGRLKGYYRITNPYDKRAIRVCENLLSFLSALEKSEKPVQEGLEEEIREYMSNEDNNPFDWDWRDKRDCARHFAKWGAEHAKEQMMEEAVEARVIELGLGDTTHIVLGFSDEFKKGDKVRVIICKKED